MTKSFLKLVSVLVIIAFSTVAFGLEPAQANIKHVLIGGLAGAGIVLAWPTITGAIGAAAGCIGSIAAGIGGAVATGVGVAGGAVAAGGAAVGGAVAGVGAAAGAAVTGGFGAIGGAIAAVTASPLFLPALLIVGAVIIGYIIYKKKTNGKSIFDIFRKNSLTPTTAAAASAPITTNYTPAIAASAAAAPAVGSSSPVAASYTPVVNSTAGTSQNIPSSFRADTATAERKPDVATTATGTGSVNAAHDKYVSAYKNYINLLSSKKSDDPEVQKALGDYKAAFEAYQSQLKANE